MNPEIKKKWTERLRSGLDKQTYGTLGQVVGNSEKRCALGVLGEIAVDEGIVEKYTFEVPLRGGEIETHIGYRLPDAGAGTGGYISQAVLGWAGIERTGRYISLNDVHKKSFPEIADWIEKNA